MKADTTSTVQNEKKTVQNILDELNKQPNSEIFLEDIVKQTGLGNLEVVKQVKEYGKGHFCVGRKGHRSRWTNKPIIKKSVAPIARKAKVETKAPNGDYKLRVQIEGKSLDLDMSTKLIAA